MTQRAPKQWKLSNAKKVANRVTGNDPGSLGLHPAVYFYTENGKHSRFLFLGTLTVFADAVRNNDSNFFKKFTKCRGTLENLLIDRKSLINQGLSNVNSRQRIDRVSKMIKGMLDKIDALKSVSDQDILTMLGLQGRIGELKIIDAPKGFSDQTKSAIYLQKSINSATRCPICSGFIDVTKAVSYDHITPIREGGTGTVENGQLLHPYCNTGIKS